MESESLPSLESIEAHSTRSRADAPSDDASRGARLAVAGELVAAITHDLRQPLTAIEMNVAAALRQVEASGTDESPVQAAERLRGAADALRDALAEQRRMREALQVLQDLAVRREPAFASVDLSESVREVVRFVSTEAFACHVRIDITAPVDLPRATADAALVRQALLNILLDSLEATSESSHREGPVSIAVRSQGTGSVDVVVTHFGVRTDSGGGWGLALARSVTDAHGGSLQVSGDPEHGLTVTTRWPVRHAGGGSARETRHAVD